MARTTKLIDEQYAVAYADAADACLEDSNVWEQYDACIEPWDAGADTIRGLYDATLILNLVQTRKAFKPAACRWFQAVTQVDALSPVEIPAVLVVLESKWNRKC